MRMCAFCKQHAFERDLVHYSRYHYAHFLCYLDRGKKIEQLNITQVGRFPWGLLRDRGLLEKAKRIIDHVPE